MNIAEHKPRIEKIVLSLIFVIEVRILSHIAFNGKFLKRANKIEIVSQM